MKKRLLICLLLGVCAALTALPAPTMATSINGTLQLGGTFTLGPTGSINFCSTGGPCPAAPGNWNVPGVGTGDLNTPYADDPNGGLITNLSNATEPVGTLVAPVLFLTFAPSGALPTPDIDFFMTELFAGVGGTAQCAAVPAPGQICTPSGTALTFLNGAGGNSSVTITAEGLAKRVSTAETDPLQIVITSQFNTPFQTVLAALAANGSVTNTYSATFTATPATTPTPEPSSLLMLSSGLIGLGFMKRKVFQS